MSAVHIPIEVGLIAMGMNIIVGGWVGSSAVRPIHLFGPIAMQILTAVYAVSLLGSR